LKLFLGKIEILEKSCENQGIIKTIKKSKARIPKSQKPPGNN
jgi:hypothetical protein